MPVIVIDDVLNVLTRVDQFEAFTPHQLPPFATSTREVAVAPGETLILECDVGGECFVIMSGEMHVVGRRFDDTELISTRIGEGRFFGEQPLLTTSTARRSASVRATGGTKLYAFGKDAFMSLAAQDTDYANRLERQGRVQAQFRDRVFKDTILTGSGTQDDLEFKTYGPGDYVFKEGDRSDRVYLVMSGSARARRRTIEDEPDLADMLPGQFFEKLAILNDAPRAASIQAISAMPWRTGDAASTARCRPARGRWRAWSACAPPSPHARPSHRLGPRVPRPVARATAAGATNLRGRVMPCSVLLRLAAIDLARCRSVLEGDRHGPKPHTAPARHRVDQPAAVGR